jgi:hypothetical protein
MPVAGEGQTHVFPIDIEHAGIRVVLPLLSLGSCFAIYFLTNAVLTSSSASTSAGVISFAAAIGGAVIVAAVADRFLKQLWPSGRTLVLNTEGLSLHNRRTGDELRIKWDGRVNVLTWRFAVKRGSSRVPKGWNMLACQLLQDETQLTLYAFAPEQEAGESRYGAFVGLVPRDALEKGDMPLREASEQRRLMRAEDERWRGGAELRRQDFAILVDALARQAPDWSTRH